MHSYSYCGLDCSKCDYREKVDCKGCQDCKGIMFWGECKIAKCVIEKGISNCGECLVFPCSILKEFAFDKEQGDNGERIEVLRKINIKETF